MENKLQQHAPQQEQANKPNLTGIPAQMKLDFEQRSGLSFDDVRVHYNSDKPTQLQALAYTQGTQVYVSPGQEKHLRHELGHVIQQKYGIVSPNILYYGHTPANLNPQLEQQADALSKALADDRKWNISSSLGTHRPVIQFALDDYFTADRQKIANILMLLPKIAENSCQKIKDCMLHIRRENEYAAMMYAWDNHYNADMFLKEIIAQIVQIKSDLESDDSFPQYYSERIKPSLPVSMDQEEWVNTEINNLIETLRDLLRDSDSQLESQESSATAVYNQSFGNQYETVRGKPLKGAQKKIFLRRLPRNSQPAPSDKRADGKIQESTNSPPDSDQRPYLRAQVWSPIINDAFVGGAIDGHSRFDIRDLDKSLWAELERLTLSDMPSADRARMFLQNICIHHSEVYDETASFKYAVLAREIAQLLYHGWIFKIIHIEEKHTLQAFQSIGAYKQYLADKIAKMVEKLVISAFLIPRDDLHRPSDVVK